MSFLSSRKLITPVIVKLEGVSMGCTLAEINMIGLLPLNLAIF